MYTEAEGRFGHLPWRGALLALVVLPFIPEVLILATSAYAAVVGCQIASEIACAVGPPSASDVIRAALQAAYFIGRKFADGNVVVAWLVLCFLLIVFGWVRLSSRLLLGLAVSLIFAFLPYFGPMLSIGPLENPACNPNEGAVGRCKIYGGNVDSAAHDAVRLGWKIFDGAPFALGTFLIFAIIAIAMHFLAKKPIAPPIK
jgi:hypothetical protein